MFSHSTLKKSLSPSVSLSLPDLLDERSGNHLSEYLALSVTRVGEDTVISLTTTDNDTVTYSTVISSMAGIDWPSLVFVAQQDF